MVPAPRARIQPTSPNRNAHNARHFLPQCPSLSIAQTNTLSFSRLVRLADIVAGPDAYRDLPRLIEAVMGTGNKAMNVVLSTEETYADIVPVRPDGTKSAFVTSAHRWPSHFAHQPARANTYARPAPPSRRCF